MIATALTVAGSDPSGGAGLAADLKTFHRHGVYGMAVVTLVTVQSTQKVSRVAVEPHDLVREQLEAVIEDIPPSAIKTGALGDAAIVREVAFRLRRVDAPLVVDPVMISKHGAPLLAEDARVALRRHLLPSARLVTPNLPEARELTGIDIEGIAGMREAGRALLRMGARAALIKGGHASGARAPDVLVEGEDAIVIDGPRIPTPAGHGTGCSHSAAITAQLARGAALVDAVRRAKRWLERALEGAPALGKGIGPVDHLAVPELE